MLFSTLIAFTSLAGAALATPVAVPIEERATCDANKRIQISQQIPYAYAQQGVTPVYNAFAAIPFGVQNLQGPCTTTIYPNGGSGIPVGVTGQGVVNFGVTSRQAFSKVTGQYKDFGANGTTVIYTEVTLGVSSLVPIPVTFSGQVYLDFNNDCRITAVRAYAEIPTKIGGMDVDLYKLLGIPQIPV